MTTHTTQLATHTRVPIYRTVARPRAGASEFWVESPLQLVSAIEAHSAGLTGDRTVIRVRRGVRSLQSTVDALERTAPAGVIFETEQAAPTALGQSPADRYGVGDLYSGQAQRALLGPSGGRELILVDDGLATLTLLRQLVADSPVPLVRQRGKVTGRRRALGVATWRAIRRRAAAGNVLVVTAMPIGDELHQALENIGIVVEGHRFEWLRAQPVDEFFPEQTQVIGSALAADGLVHADPYLAWVEAVAEDAPVGYFPHRRERPIDLRRLSAHPHITVRENTVPVEMRLRGLRPGQRVTALPSTAVPSLRLLLGGRGVSVSGIPVPDEWWTAQASPSLRAHLMSSIAPATTASAQPSRPKERA